MYYGRSRVVQYVMQTTLMSEQINRDNFWLHLIRGSEIDMALGRVDVLAPEIILNKLLLFGISSQRWLHLFIVTTEKPQ